MTKLADFLQPQIEAVTPRTPEQNIKFVEEQLDDVISGRREIMQCPFCCGLNVKPGEKDETDPVFCCQLFAVTVTTAFNKLVLQDEKDLFNRISDKAHG